MLNGVSITRDEPLKLWKVDVCTTTDHSVFKDGMRSFPSGHASSEFLVPNPPFVLMMVH
jgi:diacylglycerol diphosphate phosphatase/phosphatidate phosphatase